MKLVRIEWIPAPCLIYLPAYIFCPFVLIHTKEARYTRRRYFYYLFSKESQIYTLYSYRSNFIIYFRLLSGCRNFLMFQHHVKRVISCITLTLPIFNGQFQSLVRILGKKTSNTILGIYRSEPFCYWQTTKS